MLLGVSGLPRPREDGYQRLVPHPPGRRGRVRRGRRGGARQEQLADAAPREPGPLRPAYRARPVAAPATEKSRPHTEDGFGEADLEFLLKHIAPTYLTPWISLV